MKRLNKNYKAQAANLGLLACCIFLLASIGGCKKETMGELEDVAKNIAEYLSSSVGKGTAVYLGETSLKNKTDYPAALPIFLKEKASGSVTIKASIDKSLIKIYDSLYHTKSLDFPDNAFVLANNGTLTIEQGQVESKDSIKLLLNNGTGMEKNVVYVVPVRLDAQSAQSNLKSKYIFLKMHLFADYVKAKMDVFKSATNFTPSINRLKPYLYGSLRNTRTNGVDNAANAISFSSKIGHLLEKDVQVKIRPLRSQSALDMVNKDKYINSVWIPEDAYKIVKDLTKIKANSFNSLDSFKVQIDFAKLKELPGDKSYMLAVEIENETNKDNILPDTVNSLHRVFINIYHKNIVRGNTEAASAALTGNKIDRSNWKITASTTDQSFVASNLLDNKVSTYWRSAEKMPQELVLDMGTSATVQGFQMTPQYNDTWESFLRVKTYVSNDGNTWEFQGDWIGTSVSWDSDVNKPDIKNLKYKTPVTGRYFKFEIVEGASSKTAMAELNAIQGQ